jgi:hypothetical protein
VTNRMDLLLLEKGMPSFEVISEFTLPIALYT